MWATALVLVCCDLASGTVTARPRENAIVVRNRKKPSMLTPRIKVVAQSNQSKISHPVKTCPSILGSLQCSGHGVGHAIIIVKLRRGRNELALPHSPSLQQRNAKALPVVSVRRIGLLRRNETAAAVAV